MDFKSKDFEGLKYNPFPIPQDKNLFEVFPELSRYQEFHIELDTIDRNKVLRYLIYCYDKKSPLLSERNLVRRKMLACSIAGFELIDGKYPQAIEDMIRGHNISVNKMICRYCRNQKDMMYSLMVAGMESFFDNITKLSAPIESGSDMKELNDRAILFNHTTKMIASLESNADDVFQGDIPLLYDADLFEQEDKGVILSFPEKIASMREDGTLTKEFKKLDK